MGDSSRSRVASGPKRNALKRNIISLIWGSEKVNAMTKVILFKKCLRWTLPAISPLLRRVGSLSAVAKRSHQFLRFASPNFNLVYACSSVRSESRSGQLRVALLGTFSADKPAEVCSNLLIGLRSLFCFVKSINSGGSFNFIDLLPYTGNVRRPIFFCNLIKFNLICMFYQFKVWLAYFQWV